MKCNTLSALIVCFLVLLMAACKKGSVNKSVDKRDIYIGNYKQLTGTAKYVYDPSGYESYKGDTASLTISKNSKSDSADYIYIKGVAYAGTSDPAIKFDNNGIAIAAYVNDTAFVIPKQLPFEGSSLSIEGSGSIKSGKLELTYHSYFRAFNKYSTITSN